MSDTEPRTQESSAWLTRVLDPQRVAVIGASTGARSPGGRIMRALERYGFGGKIYPVNPTRTEILGLTCYPSVGAVPEVPDVAVVLVPAAASVEVLAECGAAGVRSVIVGSAGFGELGAEGREIQDRLLEVARRYRIRLIGPNTNGLISCRSRFTATFSPALEQDSFELIDGPVAIVSQSGALGASFFYLAQHGGVPAGTLVNTGNEVDVRSEEVIGTLASTGLANVILVYSESVRDAPALVAAAREAHASGCTIAMLKVGTTSDGALAAAAHTASLAGEDRVFAGVSRQLGIIRPGSSTELVDVARVLWRYGPVLGRRISIATLSGGVGVMLTDAATEAGLVLSKWTSDDLRRLDDILPGYLSRNNPIDVAGGPFYNLDRLAPLLASMDDQSDTDISILAICNLERLQESICQRLIEIQPTLQKPLFVVWIGGETAVARLNTAGVPAFPDVGPCIRSIALVVNRRPGSIVELTAEVPTPARRDEADGVGTAEHGADLMRRYGINIAKSRTVSSVDDIGSSLGLRLPVVAKIESAKLAHKSDVGGVLLHLATLTEVQRAVAELLRRSGEIGLDDAKVQIQEQIAPGAELLLGMVRDPTFGPVVTLGIGGVLAEALDDVQFRLPVLDEHDVADMLGQLRHQQLLAGFRGLPAVDAGAVASIVGSFAHLVRDVGSQFAAIDVNPVMIPGDGTPPVAVDWLFVR
jgi:acetate---CoA ligase (ADP-forming)